MGHRSFFGMKSIRWIHVSVFVVLLTANSLANVIPLNGVTTGQISDRYPNLFAPAEITFGIWGLIYLLLAAFVLFPFAVFGRKILATPRIVRTVSLPFILSSVFNIAWLFAWHYDRILLAMVIMLALLASLSWAYRRLEVCRSDMQFADKVFIRLPFRVYLGWITVASMTNLVILLVRLDWADGAIAQPFWTVIVLLATLLIALFITLKFKDAAYGMVILWAYLGILFRHIHTDGSGFGRQYTWVLISLTVCLVLLFTAVHLSIHRSRHRAGKQPEAGLLK